MIFAFLLALALAFISITLFNISRAYSQVLYSWTRSAFTRNVQFYKFRFLEYIAVLSCRKSSSVPQILKLNFMWHFITGFPVTVLLRTRVF